MSKNLRLKDFMSKDLAAKEGGPVPVDFSSGQGPANDAIPKIMAAAINLFTMMVRPSIAVTGWAKRRDSVAIDGPFNNSFAWGLKWEHGVYNGTHNAPSFPRRRKSSA
jgi:hypothetical protein